MTERLYWPSWFLAAVLTGIVAGFMLGHARLLSGFIGWRPLAAAPALSHACPAFRATAGRAGLDVFYAVVGLQLVGTSAFLLVALMAGRHRAAALVAGVAGALWIGVHYASGFGALEASLVRSAAGVPREVVGRFVDWNTPIHFFHAATLTVALGALLTVPLAALRRRD